MHNVSRSFLFFLYQHSIVLLLDDCRTLSSDDEDKRLSESYHQPTTRYKAKLCEITGQVTGITFEDIDRTWLRDNVYMYIAKVVTKTISFNVKLTVSFEVRREDYYTIIHSSIIEIDINISVSCFCFSPHSFLNFSFPQEQNDFKVKDITCSFRDVHDCHTLEISPWFQKIINMNNFSLFMSGE